MNRRAFLSLPLLTIAPPSRVGLIGDSLAWQLAFRLRRELAGRVQLQVHARPGSSVRQWVRKRWHAPRADLVLVSLGTNCTRAERHGLAKDVKTLLDRIQAPVLWLFPPPLRYSTQYLWEALTPPTALTKVDLFEVGPLAMESDGIHPTDAGHRAWARALLALLVARGF